MYHLWVMLLNSILRANLTKFCILFSLAYKTLFYRIKQVLHGRRQFLFQNA